MQADNFKDAFNSLGKDLIDKKDYDMYYVNRMHSPISKLAQMIRVDKRHSKILFTGHRGSGKTTELFRLRFDLEKDYFVVYYSMKDNFEISDITYTEVLLSIGFNLYDAAIKQGIKIEVDIINDLEDWMTETTEISSEEIKKGLSKEAGLSAYFFKILGKIQNEASTRVELRKKIEPKTSDLIARINTLITDISIKSGKEIIILIDDLDKPDLEIAENIFYKHSASLTRSQCKIIYTIPISLIYSNEYKQIQHNFDKPVVLTMIKTHTKEGDLYQEGITELKKIIGMRMSLDLIDAKALENLIFNTGGVIRDLLRLTADCCISAMVERKKKIDETIVESAVIGLRNDYSRMLTLEEYEKLQEVHAHKYSAKDLILLDLLHNLGVLYYMNDEDWYDVHPVVVRLLKNQKRLQ